VQRCGGGGGPWTATAQQPRPAGTAAGGDRLPRAAGCDRRGLPLGLRPVTRSPATATGAIPGGGGGGACSPGGCGCATATVAAGSGGCAGRRRRSRRWRRRPPAPASPSPAGPAPPPPQRRGARGKGQLAKILYTHSLAHTPLQLRNTSWCGRDLTGSVERCGAARAPCPLLTARRHVVHTTPRRRYSWHATSSSTIVTDKGLG
jgi:hypothetical protein